MKSKSFSKDYHYYDKQPHYGYYKPTPYPTFESTPHPTAASTPYPAAAPSKSPSMSPTCPAGSQFVDICLDSDINIMQNGTVGPVPPDPHGTARMNSVIAITNDEIEG
jgi:hypothetical protein